MSSEESVTHWLTQLRDGDGEAAQQLWERYFRRLVGLARVRLQSHPRRAADEEDVALSVFCNLCDGATRGRFPRLDDRDDLWRLLVTLTERKAINLARDERRLKRGGGAVLTGDALTRPGESTAGGFDQVPGREPTPEFAAEMAEEYQRLLTRLDDPGLRSIAVWRMEGESVGEIAARLGCAVTTVERRLRLIRQLWESEGGE
ncbi:ECF-type sigma factor [Limnoglobus roseus]|uniref:RNA polymerase subunit sigma-70 n=1 Tax=Limnoglobus roseus TaxID=2598579 RepID=A0A5C1AF66_9BACT|nr:ECF-type sigma factor [Limnoglobus roseus]QEL16372.1 RNA polymerase subunit sigma-70 [Limnoglobus roseus]